MTPVFVLRRVADALRRMADVAELEARLLAPSRPRLPAAERELPPLPPTDLYDAPGAFAGELGAFDHHERTDKP